MGMQSSRILFGGTDSKDVIFDGKYHRQMFLGNQLVWEKLADEEGVFALRTAWASKFEFSARGNVTVDWGDGTIDTNTKHTYAGNGAYTIVIKGNPESLQFGYVTSQAYNQSPVEIVYTPFPKGMKYLSQSFYGCDTLKTIPSNLFENCKNAKYLDDVFNCCLNLKSVPKELFKGMVNVKSAIRLFWISGLLDIPTGLFDDLICVEDFSGVFGECFNLKNVPDTLFDKCEKANKFGCVYYDKEGLYSSSYGAFEWCHDITSNVPELWNKFPNADGIGCFWGCTNAANYDSIPQSWTAVYR